MTDCCPFSPLLTIWRRAKINTRNTQTFRKRLVKSMISHNQRARRKNSWEIMTLFPPKALPAPSRNGTNTGSGNEAYCSLQGSPSLHLTQGTLLEWEKFQGEGSTAEEDLPAPYMVLLAYFWRTEGSQEKAQETKEKKPPTISHIHASVSWRPISTPHSEMRNEKQRILHYPTFPRATEFQGNQSQARRENSSQILDTKHRRNKH